MVVRNDFNLLEREFNENTYSHVFLIETNNLIECEKDLRTKLKSLFILDKSAEMQLENDEFIDLITIRPDGKIIKKGQIEELQKRLKVKPVFSNKLVYVITPANCLSEIAANKLLKTIEEPNDNVIGFLISLKGSEMLPTIKSRCEKIIANYSENADYDESFTTYDNYTGEVIDIIENGNLLDLNLLLIKDAEIIKYSKDIANNLKDYYNIAAGVEKNLRHNDNIIKLITSNNDKKTIINKAIYLNKLINKLSINMNSELLLEKVVIELKDVV